MSRIILKQSTWEWYTAKHGHKFGKYMDAEEFFKGLNNLVIDWQWSDYCSKLTYNQNTRDTGGLYGDGLIKEYNSLYGMEMGVFAHVQVFFMCSRDGRCWILFGNNNQKTAEAPINECCGVKGNPSDWTGVIDMIGKNRFRMLLYQQTTQKEESKEFMDKMEIPLANGTEAADADTLKTAIVQYKKDAKNDKKRERAKAKAQAKEKKKK